MLALLLLPCRMHAFLRLIQMLLSSPRSPGPATTDTRLLTSAIPIGLGAHEALMLGPPRAAWASRTHCRMLCSSTARACLTDRGSRGWENMRSRWWAPSGITTASTEADRLCRTPPPCQGSYRPLEKTTFDSASSFFPPQLPHAKGAQRHGSSYWKDKLQGRATASCMYYKP